MGRIFAGMFGSVAFLVVILRNLFSGGAVEASLESACLALAAFSAFGGWLGATAEWTIEQSVRKNVEAAFSAVSSTQPDASKPPSS
ncbi:MAG TPA: hypothetical protein PK777_01555 [Thermoguttaceae bacterium]|nr:hypothetical protein [Thermoguttaceae bacterium]HPP51607.1 hypothetical protein [Thermoguttaceae bacterium]